jgi:hypothetical protein
MRLAPPPPDVLLPTTHAHDGLLRALAVSLAALDTHERGVARSLAALGDIDLPPDAPTAQDQPQLQAAAPLYFASALENAGLLPAAELIAGLFASGTITQPLGPGAQLINTFWRGRRERLGAEERNAIFARVFEAPHFDRLMAAYCEAAVAQADGSDMREDVTLETTGQALGEFLAQRTDPMAAMAARDIVDNINAALGFLRDRMLQSAFGATSLWALVGMAMQGKGVGGVQNHVDRGRAGQSVLLWLAAHVGDPTPRLDPARPEHVEVMAAAQRWLASRPLAGANASTPSGNNALATNVAAAVPIAV